MVARETEELPTIFSLQRVQGFAAQTEAVLSDPESGRRVRMGCVPHRRAFLERLEGADRHVVSRHPLAFERERLFIGRDHTTVVKLQHPAIARKHVQLEFGPLGRWWIDDLGSSNGTWINTTHYTGTRRLLEPNDIIRFDGHGHGDVVLRYGVEGWAPKDAPMRASIDESPSDDARWQVWADFLEEQGDPLAERIRGVGPSPGDVGVGSGHGWEHGFIARGVLQRGGRVIASLRTELQVLLGNPFSRWMRTLHVDLASYLDDPAEEEPEALEVMEILARERPAALCVLTFHLSALPSSRRLQRLRTKFGELKQVLPKLLPDFDALLLP
jgi:uncharacterized protein (TIGR02996 family)